MGNTFPRSKRVAGTRADQLLQYVRLCRIPKIILQREDRGEFEALLKGCVPSEGMFQLAFELLRDLWNRRLESSTTEVTALQESLRAIERKVEQLLDRIVEASGEAVIPRSLPPLSGGTDASKRRRR